MTKKEIVFSVLPALGAVFVCSGGYGMMIAFFTPLFIKIHPYFFSHDTTLATSTEALGLLLFCYPIAQFLGNPILGALSDNFGRKKILLVSLALTALGYLGIALSVIYASYISLLIFFIFTGAVEGSITLAQSATADITLKNERAQFFGYIYLSQTFAYIIGPLIGSIWSTGRSTAFYILIAMCFACFLWVLISFHEKRKLPQLASIQIFASLTNVKNILTQKRLRYFFGINFMFYFALFGFFRTYPAYLWKTFSLSHFSLGLWIAWFSMPFICINVYLLPRIAKQFKLFWITLSAALYMGVLLFLFPTAQTKPLGFTVLFFVGLGAALLLSSCAALLSTYAFPSEQGKMMGNNQSMQFLAEALGAFIGGLLLADRVPVLLYFILGAISLAGALGLFFKRNSQPEGI